MNPVDRAFAAAESRIMKWRHRSRWFDHLSRAWLCYADVQGARLAAAIAYYGFFAIFALLLIGYSLFGILLNSNTRLFDIVRDFLRQNVPFLDLHQLLSTGKTVGFVGIIGLTFTGVAWVEAIRSSQRAIWKLNQNPGYVILRQLLDLLILIVVLVLLAASQAAAYGAEEVLDYLADGHIGFVLSATSFLFTVLINMVLGGALLGLIPRIRMTLRRALPPVLLVGIGITLLNTVGKTFVGRVQHNPAYALVASAVGALVYLYAFNQILLIGAAWAATSPHGKAFDLSARDKSAPVGENVWIGSDRRREPAGSAGEQGPDAGQVGRVVGGADDQAL